ncbi:Resolvase/invertase-type recombinase catalytic domain-containing protein [Mycobacterium sp. smrl_JER01]
MQHDALLLAGVEVDLVYTDELDGIGRDSRSAMAALLDDARAGDILVVVGMDRLGRSPAEVLETLVDVGDRGLALRSLREDLDTSTAVGHVVVGVLASLGVLEREARRERRAGPARRRRERGQHVGRPRALTAEQQTEVARRYADGESVASLAEAFGVSRDTVYRALARED